MSKLPMTAAGHSALEDELKHRMGVERPRLLQRIQDTTTGRDKPMGDRGAEMADTVGAAKS